METTVKNVSEMTEREISEETLLHLRELRDAIENFDMSKVLGSLENSPMGAILGSLIPR